jgi:hypothetical protein
MRTFLGNSCPIVRVSEGIVCDEDIDMDVPGFVTLGGVAEFLQRRYFFVGSTTVAAHLNESSRHPRHGSFLPSLRDSESDCIFSSTDNLDR